MSPYQPPENSATKTNTRGSRGQDEAPQLQSPKDGVIFKLPNELLAAVASQLRQNNDLRRLALVCTRLRDIAQSILLRPAKLPRDAVRKFLEMLIDRPDLAKRVRHVDLGNYSGKGDFVEREDAHPGDFDIRMSKRFMELIIDKHGDELWNDILQTRQADRWGNGRSFYLALLAIMAPNLHNITFEMRPLTRPPQFLTLMPTTMLLGLQESGPPFGATVMKCLAERLEVLTIADNPLGNSAYMHNLTFKPLYKLQRLSVPIETLVSKNAMATDPLLVFPESLRILQVRCCNKFILELLIRLYDSRLKLPALDNIDLLFKCSLRSAILLAGEGDDTRIQGLYNTVKLLSLSGVTIKSYTQPYRRGPLWDNAYVQSDIHTELDAWFRLSIGDVMMGSMKNAKFSTVVARNIEGAPRERTDFEERLFRKFWGMPVELFTSPTFRPRAWSGVRMFNGFRGFKKAPNDLPKPSPPKHTDQKQKTETRKAISTEAFKKTPPMTSMALVSSTFHTFGWMDVDFFPKVDTKEQAPSKPAIAESPRRRKTTSGGDTVEEIAALAKAWKL